MNPSVLSSTPTFASACPLPRPLSRQREGSKPARVETNSAFLAAREGQSIDFSGRSYKLYPFVTLDGKVITLCKICYFTQKNA